jgi:hypothetical protein
MTREEAALELDGLLRISRSCKYGYPMDISDEQMLEKVIAYLREDDYDYRRDPANQPENIR